MATKNTDTDTDTDTDLPPIQLLLPHVLTADHDGQTHAWLNAFCLLTMTPGAGTVEVTGKVLVGERYSDNVRLLQHLNDALDPSAVLAGYDLDETIAKLGRLPIDAEDSAPALDLLGKLHAMIENQCVIDMGCSEALRRSVRDHAAIQELELVDEIDSSNPDRLASALRDMAGACLLALSDAYVPAKLEMDLIIAWTIWHREQAVSSHSAVSLTSS